MNPAGSNPVFLSSQAARNLVSELLAALPTDRPFDAHKLLDAHPDLRAHKSIVLDLAHEDFYRQVEAGNDVTPSEFARRFPTWERSVRHLIDVERYLQNDPRILDELSRVDWPEAGTTFLDFQLVEELGRGGFSRVFLARETGLGDRQVVVKVCQRGAREAHTLGKLEHPGIVPVHSVRQDAQRGLTAICMPYLGRTTLFDVLDHLLAAQTLPSAGRRVTRAVPAAPMQIDNRRKADAVSELPFWDRPYVDAVVDIGIQLAEALAFTHARGICHCDIKPSNVLMTAAGRAMLFDFNLAFLTESDGANIGGTLPYMAPEQLQAIADDEADIARPDGRTDLFAVGVTLYELLSGRLPFGPIPTEGARNQVARQLLERQRGAPPPLKSENKDVDARLSRLIETCLSFDPAGRPQSAATLAAALRKELSPYRRIVRRLRRHKMLVAASAVTLGVGLFLQAQSQPPPEPIRPAAMQAGHDAYRQELYPQAVLHFTSALELGEDRAEALFARGQAYMKQGDYRAALVEFNEAVRLVSDENLAACRAFCQAALNEDIEQAVRYYTNAIKEGRATAAIHNNLGYCLLRLDRPNTAQAHFRQAVVLDDTLGVAHYNLASLDFRDAFKDSSRRMPNRTHILAAIDRGLRSAGVYLLAARIHALSATCDANDAQRLLHCRQAITFSELALRNGLDPQQLEQVADSYAPLRSEPDFLRLLHSTARPTTVPDVVQFGLVNPLEGSAEPLTLSRP